VGFYAKPNEPLPLLRDHGQLRFAAETNFAHQGIEHKEVTHRITQEGY